MAEQDSAYRVLISPTAARQFEAAELWWRTNRPAAPRLLTVELATALLHISEQPSIGRRAESAMFKSVRVLLLRRSQYNVYYQVDEAAHEVHVVYFRHARRRPLSRR